MFTDRELREASAKRARVLLPAMAGSVAAVFLYLRSMGLLRDSLTPVAVGWLGEMGRDIIPIALILPAFAIFLLPSCLAVKYTERFKIACPSCREDLSSRVGRILFTRYCPRCGDRILEGRRTRSSEVYKRYQAIRSRRLLRLWLWAWPALGGLFLVWGLFDHSMARDCPQCLWIAPLVGTAAAGWVWLRTGGRGYLPQFLTSVLLLGLGVVLSWRAI